MMKLSANAGGSGDIGATGTESAEIGGAAETAGSAAMFSNPKLLAASMALKVLGAQQKRKEMDMLNRFEAQKSQRSGIQNQLANLAGFYQKSGIV